MKSVKSKSKRLVEWLLLLVFIAQYFLLLSIDIPKYIQIPLLSGVVLVVFYFLYSLFRLNTIVTSSNGVIVFFALNGNFIFPADDILFIKSSRNFLSRIFDYHIVVVHKKNGAKKIIYLPDMSDYKVLVNNLNNYVRENAGLQSLKENERLKN